MNRLIALLSLLALLSVPSSMGAKIHAKTEGETGQRMMRKRRKAIQKMRQATKHNFGNRDRTLQGKGGKGGGILQVSSFAGTSKGSYSLVETSAATGTSSLIGSSKGSYGLVGASAVTGGKGGKGGGRYFTACGGGKGSKGVNCAPAVLPETEIPIVEEDLTETPTCHTHPEDETTPPTVSQAPSVTPSSSPSQNPSSSPSAEPSNSPSSSPSPEPTPLPTVSIRIVAPDPTAQPSAAPSSEPTESPTCHTLEPTLLQTLPDFGIVAPDPTPSPSGEPSVAPSVVPSALPSSSPSGEPSPAPSDAPTESPYPSGIPSLAPTSSQAPSSAPSSQPSESPSANPSDAPSSEPTESPTCHTSEPTIDYYRIIAPDPTPSPSGEPSVAPSSMPSSLPSSSPSGEPSLAPSNAPTESPYPSGMPSLAPTSSQAPSSAPSSQPSESPSASPSNVPSSEPTEEPTPLQTLPNFGIVAPDLTQSPSFEPSGAPSSEPSAAPSDTPSTSPSVVPSALPSESPTESPYPSGMPSLLPTTSQIPSDSPSSTPSSAPSDSPSTIPSSAPSSSPSGTPSNGPSEAPSTGPSTAPSDAPTINPTTGAAIIPPDVSIVDAATKAPSNAPSARPSGRPSSSPSYFLSSAPSSLPSLSPSACGDHPTAKPAGTGELMPSDNNILDASTAPPSQGTAIPTSGPTSAPTSAPTVGTASLLPPADSALNDEGTATALPTAAPSLAACTPEVILEAENFEGSESEAAWTSGSTYFEQGFSQFLGRFGLGSEEMSRSFLVPRGLGPDKMMADKVQIQFALYQIDNWTATDQFFVGINGIIFNLGEMDTTSISVDLSGEVGGIKWERQTIAQGSDRGFGSQNDKKHLVKLDIPASVFPDETIRLGFRALSTNVIESESAGIDDLVITAYYDCAKEPSSSPSVATILPTAAPTASPTTAEPSSSPSGATTLPTAGPTVSPTTADPTMAPTLGCMPEVILESENFEVSGSEVAWSSGTTSNATGFSHFLGPLGMGNEVMKKSFSVPPGLGPEQMEADTVSIEFSLYQIDDWTPTDQFLVEINGIVVDVGEMSSTGTSVDLGGEVSGIKWERQTFFQGSNAGFGSQNDKKHLVKLKIPASVFPDDKISIGFRTVSTRAIESESAGVDDLVIAAYYDCAKEPSSSPSVAPSLTPSSSPSQSSSSSPSMAPSSSPSAVPTPTPSSSPSQSPSSSPPSSGPSMNPTARAPVASTLSPVSFSIVGCEDDSLLCPDGSTVARNVDDQCNFFACPSESTCDEAQFQCPDGTFVSRDSSLGCEFQPCPSTSPSPTAAPSCDDDQFICSDGTIVTRDISLGCEFQPCPSAAPTTSPVEVLRTPSPVSATLQPRATLAPVGTGEYPAVNTFSGDNRFGPCQADSDGLFGWGNEAEKRTLQFKYELETKTAPSDLLIFTMQQRIMENTLPVLFPDQCFGDHGLNRDRERRLRRLFVVGVSAGPNDAITDLSCKAQRSFNNNCVVVDAKLSIFTDNGGGNEAMDDIMEVLKETMQEGVFNYGRMGIIRIELYQLYK